MEFSRFYLILSVWSRSYADEYVYDNIVSESLAEMCPAQLTCPSRNVDVLKRNVDVVDPCCQECSCEDICVLNGACCLSYHNKTKSPPPTNVRCQKSWFSVGYLKFKGPQYLVVNKCLDGVTDLRTMQSCTKPANTLKEAQLVSTTDGKIYKNAYCAECNGVKEFIEWQLRVSCRESLPLSKFGTGTLDFETLKVEFGCVVVNEEPANQTFQALQCRHGNHIFDTCDPSRQLGEYDLALNRSCNEMQTGHYYSDGFVFKNVFCYLCNPSFHEKKGVCDIGGGFDPRVLPSSFSFIALINLADDSDVSADVAADAICGSAEIYDHLKGICRAIRCAPLSVPVAGECTSVMDGVLGYSVRVFITLRPLSYMRAFDGLDVDSLLQSVGLRLDAQINVTNINNCSVCYIPRRMQTHEHTNKGSNGTTVIDAVIRVRTTSTCPIYGISHLAESLEGVQLDVVSDEANVTYVVYLMSGASIDRDVVNDDVAHDNKGCVFAENGACCDLGEPYTSVFHCASVEMSGMEYLDAINSGYISGTNHRQAYEDMSRVDASVLRNVTVNVCVEDYMGVGEVGVNRGRQSFNHGSVMAIVGIGINLLAHA